MGSTYQYAGRRWWYMPARLEVRGRWWYMPARADGDNAGTIFSLLQFLLLCHIIFRLRLARRTRATSITWSINTPSVGLIHPRRTSQARAATDRQVAVVLSPTFPHNSNAVLTRTHLVCCCSTVEVCRSSVLTPAPLGAPTLHPRCRSRSWKSSSSTGRARHPSPRGKQRLPCRPRCHAGRMNPRHLPDPGGAAQPPRFPSRARSSPVQKSHCVRQG